ncbi:hypothetical protein TELCIR_16877, partial [Teladorsagia circumcincta]
MGCGCGLFESTFFTFQFAKLAKKIVTRPVVNEVNDDGLLSKCLREIELLKQELESKKIRRQTWAPGNGPLLPSRAGSFSPPRKRERALGAIEECGGQTSDEKIWSTGLDMEEKPDAGDGLVIPIFVQNERRSISKVDVDAQTSEPYPVDRSDEVATLKKGNASLAEQLSAKTKLCKELETQITENDANPSDRKRLLHRIEEQYEELCKLRKEVSQTKAFALKDADSLALERASEIESLKEALAASVGQVEMATRLAADTRESVERELEQRYSAALKASEEEVQQLRKDNTDLSSRIDILLRSSGCVTEEEAMSLREEITELKDVIERKNKALEVAKMHQDELEACSVTVERLSREKKDLTMRLKLKTENVEMLSSRVNSLRDEINEKQAEITKAKNASKSAEVNLEK